MSEKGNENGMMKRYSVRIDASDSTTLQIEAESEYDAEQMALDEYRALYMDVGNFHVRALASEVKS